MSADQLLRLRRQRQEAERATRIYEHKKEELLACKREIEAWLDRGDRRAAMRARAESVGNTWLVQEWKILEAEAYEAADSHRLERHRLEEGLDMAELGMRILWDEVEELQNEINREVYVDVPLFESPR